jgi:uncharacterized membrane protein YkgB
MVSKLTVLFLIVLLLQLGVLLVLLPWVNFGAFGNWNENYLLALVSEKTGMPEIRGFVSSGWVKGAVTGVGILNILIALLEIANFKNSVAALEGGRSK